MRPEHWFVVAITVLEWSAGTVYGYHSDWRHAIFWTCAGIMNIVVTW